MSDDIDSLLDMTLDDLEDLPEFKNYPPGAHKLFATFGEKEVNGKEAVELAFKYVEVVELVNDDEEAPKEGDEATLLFFMDNEFGRGNLKKVAMPFAKALNLSTIRDVIDGVKDVECVAITTVRKDKNNPDREYMGVKEIEVL